MKNMLASLLLATCGLLFAGCSPDPQGASSSAGDALRSPFQATSFFTRAPVSDPHVEALRANIDRFNMGYVWGRNQGDVVAIQWETNDARPLTDEDRDAVAQAAFRFYIQQAATSDRLYLEDLTKSATGEAAFGDALAKVGFQVSSSDPETEAALATLLGSLRDAASTPGVSIHTAALDYQVDMYWEGALVVIDEQNRQLVIATGGFGT